MNIDTVGARELPVALAGAIRHAKHGDPMAAVLVWVPNSESARALSRSVAAVDGVLNVRFLTGRQIAEVLIPPLDQLPKSHRLTNDLKRELIRTVARHARPPLGNSATPVLIQELLKAFDELRNLTHVEIEGIAELGPLQAEIVRIFGDYRKLAAVFHDDVDLFDAAQGFVTVTEPPHVVVVGIEPTSPHEVGLLNELRSVDKLSMVQLCNAELEVDSLSPGSVVVAPDPAVEVQCAVENVLLKGRSGVRFPRVAVVHSGSAQYAGLIQRQLEAAGVPWRGRSSETFGQSVAGRVLGSLTDAVAEGLTRDSFFEWLESGPILLRRGGGAVPVSDWLAAARRLRATNDIDDLIDRAKTAGETQLHSFVDELRSSVPGSPAAWSEWVEWTHNSAARYLGGEEVLQTWPAEERTTLLKILSSIDRLARLDGVGSTVDAASYAAAVKDELAVVKGRPYVPEGVFVGRWTDVVGCTFDTVIACGLGDGAIEKTVGGLASSIRVPGAETKSNVSQAALLRVLGAADDVLLTCARTDTRAGRERRPAPLLIEIAAQWAGCPVTATDLVEGSMEVPWLQVVHSFASTLSHAEISSSDLLDRLKELSLTGEVPEGARPGFDVQRSRATDRLTRFDGASSPLSMDQQMSATSLETWATCPYRFFLKSVLHLGDDESDDDPWTLAAKDRGQLVHEVLEEFVRTAPQLETPQTKWSPEQRDRLHRLADERFAKAKESGAAPAGLLLEAEVETLHAHLEAFLDNDEVLRAESGTLPGRDGVEVSFSNFEIRRPGGAPVRFKGRIDRIDKSVDGTKFRALDYKTGKAAKVKGLKDDPVAAGRHLQAALYAAVVEAQAPNGSHIDSSYWFITDDYSTKEVKWGGLAAERLGEVVDTMTTAIEAGVFPAVPGDDFNKTHENCRHCPYDSICPVDRAEVWERKAADPAVAPFFSLKKDAG